MRTQLTEHAQRLIDWPRNDVDNPYYTAHVKNVANENAFKEIYMSI
jgi:hypothetical protein